MLPKEYQLPEKATHALISAFQPFLNERFQGMPLGDWLAQPKRVHQRNGDAFLPPALNLRLAATLQSVLAQEGGPEGLALLEGMDGVIHGGGTPALLVHGIPAEGTLGVLIHQAFREALFKDSQERFRPMDHLKDAPNERAMSGFEAVGYRALHQDDSDITLLQGVTGGDNPRYTEVLTLAEFAARAAHGAETSPAVVEELLCLPIWRVQVAGYEEGEQKETGVIYDRARAQEANRLGLLRRGENGVQYAPLFYPNSSYHEGEPGSARYRMLTTPFSQLEHRLDVDPTYPLPPHLQADMYGCVESLQKLATTNSVSTDGVMLQANDLLILNNRVLVHAGGVFRDKEYKPDHALRRGEKTARHVITSDVHQRPPHEYSVRPGEHGIKPINMGKLEVIEPAMLTHYTRER